jgi:hypothetical protein
MMFAHLRLNDSDSTDARFRTMRLRCNLSKQRRSARMPTQNLATNRYQVSIKPIHPESLFGARARFSTERYDNLQVRSK